eukprot:8523-Heterococcus_DN1.PRE.1
MKVDLQVHNQPSSKQLAALEPQWWFSRLRRVHAVLQEGGIARTSIFVFAVETKLTVAVMN